MMHNTLVQYHLLLVESAGPGPDCKRHHVLTQDLHTRSAPSGKIHAGRACGMHGKTFQGGYRDGADLLVRVAPC